MNYNTIKMKKLLAPILLSLLLIFSFQSLVAQPPGGPGGRGDRGEKMKDIESMKIAFITKRLSLSPEEAKTFWPVYDGFSSEIRSIREARFSKLKEAKGELDNMSDNDVDKLIEDDIAFRQQEVDVLKKYNPRFKQILPIKKVAKLYKAEEDFKRELLDKIRDRKMQKGGDGR